MSDSPSLPPLVEPDQLFPVRELLIEAKVNVDAWSIARSGRAIENPNENIYRAARWAFGGGNEPTVLCIWFKSIDRSGATAVHVSNLAEALKASAPGKTGGERALLTHKQRKAAEFGRLVYDAHRDRKPVRVILLGGNEAAVENAATESSKTFARTLDPADWYVHEYDVATERYRLVRGVPPVILPPPDPYAFIDDPGEDPAFQEAIADLSETERETLIKARVGHGAFRDALWDRWGGCAVTRCVDARFLVASHIRPWSQCTTKIQRLSPDNGLLLTPNLDCLFDRGFISFDDRFRIKVSSELKDSALRELGLDRNMRLRHSTHEGMLPYLEWHRSEIFRS